MEWLEIDQDKFDELPVEEVFLVKDEYIPNETFLGIIYRNEVEEMIITIVSVNTITCDTNSTHWMPIPSL